MEDECQKHTDWIYNLVGRTDRGYTWFGRAVLFFLFGGAAYIVYRFIFPKDENQMAVLHFITLAFFYCGVMWVVYAKRPIFLQMARECDQFIGLNSREYKEEYKRIRKQLDSSKLKFGADYMSCQVFVVVTFIAARPFLRHLIQGAPREFVISGTEENDIIFWSLNIFQFLFMMAAGVSISSNTQLYMRICLHIMCKYRLLNYALANMKYDPSLPKNVQIAAWNKTVRECGMHYTHILGIFHEFRAVCGYSFIFIYFGLLGSVTLSRSAVTGAIICLCCNIFGISYVKENPDYAVLPEFAAESSYIFIHCLCFEDVITESDKIIFSIYSSDWLHFPRSTIKMLMLIGLRSRKQPLVPLFRGGSAATLQTYGVFMNASMAYFMSAIMLS